MDPTSVSAMINPTWQSSPVAETVALILDVYHPGTVARRCPSSGCDYLVASYREDFSELWTLDDALLDWLQSGKRTIVLVWDETPVGSMGIVNVADHLTPFDWAVAVSLKFNFGQAAGARPEKTSQPNWRLIILDFFSQQHAGSETVELFERLQRGASPMLPWVHVFSPIEAEELLVELSTDWTPSRGLVDLEFVRRLWASALSRPGDRHTISNLVGPQLLLAGLKCESMPSSPLASLLKSVGLAPDAAEKEPGPWVENRELVASGDLECVLVDDQVSEGWGDFLCAALGVNPIAAPVANLKIIGSNGPLKFSVCASPDYLIDRLKSLPGSDQRFQFSVGTGESPNEILFLDLRLYATRSWKEESEFFQRLIGIARTDYFGRNDLPWPAISADEIERLDRWLNRFGDGNAGPAETRPLTADDAPNIGQRMRQSAEYLEALTLFPRILALTDLSLPIVIFSSAGGKVVNETLTKYGNLITDFEKPRFFDYNAGDIVARARASFVAALKRALSVSAARRVCRRVLASAEASKPAVRPRLNGFSHFELYLDESGASSVVGDIDAASPERGRFVIAGLLIAYPHATHPDEGPLGLHNRMAAHGMRWWPAKFRSRYLVKRGPVDDTIDLPGAHVKYPNQVIRDFHGIISPAKVLGVCLEYQGEVEASEAEFLDPSRGDNRYRQMLSLLIELVIFELLPEIAQPDVSISLFPATRVRGAQEFKGKRATIERLRELYGYEGPDSNRYVRTLVESSIAPIVAQILGRRESRTHSIRIEHARGVTLAYPTFETLCDHERGKQCQGCAIEIRFSEDHLEPVVSQFQPNWEKTRHQHYIADLVAGACRERGSRLVGTSHWRSLFESGLYDISDAGLTRLSTASRAAQSGDIVEALMSLAGCEDRPVDPISGAAIMLRGLAEAIRMKLCGSEFVTFASELAGAHGLEPASGMAVETGMVAGANLEDGYGFIAVSTGDDVYFPFAVWKSATEPMRGEVVEFERSKRAGGRPRALWVRSRV